MTRRFEVGPLLVALGAAILLVSLFLEWYGTLTAWEAFEVVEVLLAVLADRGAHGRGRAAAARPRVSGAPLAAAGGAAPR